MDEKKWAERAWGRDRIEIRWGDKGESVRIGEKEGWIRQNDARLELQDALVTVIWINESSLLAGKAMGS